MSSSLDVDLQESNVSVPGLGLKLNLYSSDRNTYAIQYNTLLNVAYEKGRLNNMTLITNHVMSPSSSFSTNLGISYDHAIEYYYVLNYAQNIIPSLFLLVEFYGRGGEVLSNYYDVGIGWLASDKLQLDVYSGTSFKNSKDNFFVNVGLSYRLDL